MRGGGGRGAAKSLIKYTLLQLLNFHKSRKFFTIFYPVNNSTRRKCIYLSRHIYCIIEHSFRKAL